jgi:ABC-type glycerol-3-phosphate transport system permease component
VNDDEQPGRGRRIVRAIPAALIALAFVLPTYWMVISALRPEHDIFAYLQPLSVQAVVPRAWTLDNFQGLIDAHFLRATWNSILVAFLTTAVGLLISIPAAFAFAVLRFPLRNALFAVVVIAFSIPFDAIAIPLAGLFREWGLDNSYAGLVLPGLGNGFAIFLLRQFFAAVPPSLSEAARLDGASWWRIVWRIYVPLSRPALVGAGMVLFIYQWQAYLWPLLEATDPDKQLAPITLAGLSTLYQVKQGEIFAGAVILAVIPGVVLFVCQRFFTQSISTSGTNG